MEPLKLLFTVFQFYVINSTKCLERFWLNLTKCLQLTLKFWQSIWILVGVFLKPHLRRGETRFSHSIICKSIPKSHHGLKYKKNTYQNNLEKLFPGCKIFKRFKQAPGSCSSWCCFNVTEQEWNNILPLEVHMLYQAYITILKAIQSSFLQPPLFHSFAADGIDLLFIIQSLKGKQPLKIGGGHYFKLCDCSVKHWLTGSSRVIKWNPKFEVQGYWTTPGKCHCGRWIVIRSLNSELILYK